MVRQALVVDLPTRRVRRQLPAWPPASGTAALIAGSIASIPAATAARSASDISSSKLFCSVPARSQGSDGGPERNRMTFVAAPRPSRLYPAAEGHDAGDTP